MTNFSPLLDNVRIRMTGLEDAPAITFDVGCRFQDAFPQGTELETNALANADIARDLNMQDETRPDHLGDSIAVTGPGVNPQGSNRWEARLYFRVVREGPAQRSIPRYLTWYERVKDGFSSITGSNAPFAYGWMDSIELALVQKNRFCSQFREDDDDFSPGPPGQGYDQGEDNEIIWDNMLTPGTKVEYFIASNFLCTPAEQYVLPDTTGRFYTEFEVLPGYRMDSGVAKFPCVLYVDAHNLGAQIHIENALNTVLHGAPPLAPLPDPADWDRYDYLDATSNWCAPLFRGGPGLSNAGASLAQLLGYHAILVNTGDSESGVIDPRDWVGFADWLAASDCGANGTLQGLILNGDNMGAIVHGDAPNFLQNVLGAAFRCSDYYDPACPPEDPDNDENECVRLEYSPGGPFAPTLAADVFANWCPAQLSYDVLATAGGVANKVYSKIGTGARTEFAQIANDQAGPAHPSNYRSLLDGFSYHHMTRRDPDHPGPSTECPTDPVSITASCTAEIQSALRWALNISNPLQLGLCLDPCVPPEPNAAPVDPGGESAAIRVNQLWQSTPNPFNPRTVIRFSLVADGTARLVLYDVGGRQVRTLVQGRQTAGPHEVVWDATDDAGLPVSAGIYWSQLLIGEYRSSRKLVLLR